MEREFEEKEALRSYYMELLEMYMKDLEKKVEHAKVIAHAADVDIFLNRYLLEEGVGDLNEAACMVDDYFVDFFVPRCKWASPRTVKSTALHLKEFFKCMVNHKEIDEDLYSEVCSVITDNLEIWQSESKWVIYPPFDRRS